MPVVEEKLDLEKKLSQEEASELTSNKHSNPYANLIKKKEIKEAGVVPVIEVKRSALVKKSRHEIEGRPPTKRDVTIELTRTLLNGKAQDIVKKVLDIAMKDEHPKQMDAIKMCLDRIAPASFFENDLKAGQGTKIDIKVSITDPRAHVPVVYEDAQVVEGDSGKDP